MRGSGHEIVGNMIGTDPDGEEPVPNGIGIELPPMRRRMISRNVISGEPGRRLYLAGVEDKSSWKATRSAWISTASSDPEGLNGISLVSTIGVLIGGTEARPGTSSRRTGRTADRTGTLLQPPVSKHHPGNLIGAGADGSDLGKT